MADFSTVASSAMQSANQVAYTASWFSIILLFSALLITLVVFLIYKRSFNVDVMIVKSANGIDFSTGFKGKFYLKGNNNEYRFKIWAAKKHKLIYNQENISPKHIYETQDAVTRKGRKLVILSPNSEGYLVPLTVSPQIHDEMYEVLLSDGVTKQQRMRKTSVLKSEYGSVDVSWLQGEAQKFKELFDGRGFLDKWGTLLILIGMILVTGGLLYTAYKFAAASSNMTEVLRSQTQLVETILRAQNSSIINIGQPINTIVAG